MKLSNNKHKQLEILLYKLLHDALFLWALAFAFFLIAEPLLPGYLTAHIGFDKLIAAFFAIGLSAAYFGKRNALYFEAFSLKKFLQSKTAILASLISAALIALSLWKFEKLEIAIITAATLAILYYLLKIFFEEE